MGTLCRPPKITVSHVSHPSPRSPPTVKYSDDVVDTENVSGPTRGASEEAARSWVASPALARSLRIAIFMAPLGAAWLVVGVVGPDLYRPAGGLGLVAWLAQAAPLTITAAMLTDRWASRLLPLVTLLGMSLTFPDQAPSRFGVALRTGTAKQRQARLAELREAGLDPDEATAATQAIELVSLLGNHERLTRGHTERVRAYTELIAVEMGIGEEDRSKLAWAALLHDIGKLTVPAAILNKTEKLTDEEWEILKSHPSAGEAFIAPLAEGLGEWTLATSEHHERWDGGGYPRGLAGHAISRAGRIVAVADAYDVITSKRSYKDPMTPEAARRELVACAGTQFDPAVVKAMIKVSIGKRRTSTPWAWLMGLPGASGLASGVSAVPAVAVASLVGLGGALTSATSVEAAPRAEPMSVSDIADSSADSSAGPAARNGGRPAGLSDGAVGSSTTTSAGTPLTTTSAVAGSGSSGPTIPTFGSNTTIPPLPTTTIVVVPPPLPTTSVPPTTMPPVGPTPLPDLAIVSFGNNKDIDVLANDLPGSSPLVTTSLRVVSGPRRGSVSVVNGMIRYSSGGSIIGVDTLTYEVCDRSELCATAVLTITTVLG